jgi:hypothetical protein
MRNHFRFGPYLSVRAAWPLNTIETGTTDNFDKAKTTAAQALAELQKSQLA